MNKNNFDESFPSRIVNLDFLRGLFILFALDQHFTYYINMWYVEFFKDSMALTSTYKIHFPLIGSYLPMDQVNRFLSAAFLSWVSQIYIGLAAFNLAKKTQNSFKAELNLKLKMYFIICLYFIMENFIVAPNTGQAISIYPIILWMFILSLLAIVYRFIGVKGVVVLTGFSFLHWLFPVESLSNMLQHFVVTHVHPGFEYDARLEYFLTSGCIGFLLGYIHYHRPSLAAYKDFYFFSLGMLLISFHVFWDDPVIVSLSDAYAHEHDVAQTFTGMVYLIGMEMIVVSLFLWLEKKSIRLNFSILNWIGRNSIFIFGFHRIFFIHVLAPISCLVGTMYGRTMTANTVEIFAYIAITIAVCYFIKISRMGEIILQIK